MSDAPRTTVPAMAGEIVIPRTELAGAGMGLDRTTLQPVTTPPSTTAGGTTGGTAAGGTSPFSPFGAPIVTPPAGTEPAKELAKPAEPKVHEVASGDNLTKIAKKYYGSKTTSGIALIRAANSLTEESTLRVGQKLTIPELKADGKTAIVSAGKAAPAAVVEPVAAIKPGSLYTVKSGDTLPRISKRAYGTPDKWHEIWLANFSVIEDPEKVSPGTRLKLPM
jgi:nucleoid-associated protein YgaU